MGEVTETEQETGEAEATPPEEQEKPTEEQGEASSEGAEAKGEESQGTEEKPDEAKGSAPAEAEEKRKRAGGWQRKIDRLERQNEMLVQQLATQRPSAQPSGLSAAEKTAEEKATEWIDRLVEERLSKREQERQTQTAHAEFQRRTAEVRAATPDFEEVILSASDIPVSPAVTQALLTSEHGPAIMYQLAKSPAELARISALPPLDAAREIGRLEAKLPSSTASPKTTKPAIRPPVPPTNVNGSTSNTRNLDDLPISEYKRAYRSGRR